jgi:hypothetical protein
MVGKVGMVGKGWPPTFFYSGWGSFLVALHDLDGAVHTYKKFSEIFLAFKEIQKGLGAPKSYMRMGFIMHGEMRKNLVIDKVSFSDIYCTVYT